MIEYKTVQKQAQASFTEQRSKFIGYIKPVDNEEDAINFISEIKSKHWDAKHNVYAYCIKNSQIKRYSDDGEPQGTAGMPVLDVLVKNDITNAVIVVTRYFGGVLLGTGGLVRAYSHSARIALEKANIITMRLCTEAYTTCDYSQYGKVSSIIPEYNGVIDCNEFTESVIIYFHIDNDNLSELQKKLANATCGTVKITINGEKFYSII